MARLKALLLLLAFALTSQAVAAQEKAVAPPSSKVWFVTGSNRGNGLAIARAALNAGHRVVATTRQPAQARAALGDQGDRLLIVPLDVTRPDQAEAAVAAAKERFGRIDVLVNNAGYGQLGWFENTSDALIRRQFETNLFGAMNVTRAVLPVMRQQRSGHVFTVSSVAGLVSVSGSSVYSASKFAVEGWMEGLAAELKPLGIASTIVEPGFFRTDFLDASSVSYGDRNIAEYAEASAKFRAWHDEMNHKQVGDPAKLGAAIVKISAMASPPLRFAAGSDAYGLVIKKAQELREGAEQVRELSISTDGNWPSDGSTGK
ncbi:SDR family NAD(P)-dependent oxidoreductase [Xanthomonas hortorum]|nr:SDR family NAD(P)-dependent oxidoreductase [Xanthomonas hortorum]